ncbi:hypothetical protein D3C81_252000 [compost metagenome]
MKGTWEAEADVSKESVTPYMGVRSFFAGKIYSIITTLKGSYTCTSMFGRSQDRKEG